VAEKGKLLQVMTFLIQPRAFSKLHFKLSDMLDVAEVTRVSDVHQMVVQVSEEDVKKYGYPEAIFEELNLNRDEYPISYSMSVNDIALILIDWKWEVWQCLHEGWKRISVIPAFLI
jgi:hypothetical protein